MNTVADVLARPRAPVGRSAGRRPRRLTVALAVGVVAGVALTAGVPRLGATRVRVGDVGEDRPATAMDDQVQPANNSPVLVADPGDSRFVAMANRLDGPDFSCDLQVSGDGGASWIPAGPVPHLPPGAEKCYGPEVAFNRAGRLFYLFVGLAGRGNEPMGVFLTSSGDRGRTWSVPHQVLGPLNFAARMAIDPAVGRSGRMYLVWLHATSQPPLGGFLPEANPILAAHSDDGGTTFSAPAQVSDAARARVVAPALAVGPGHVVQVAYYDLKGDARDYEGLAGPTWEGTWSIVLTTSADGGNHFRPGTVVDDAIAPPERVMLIYTMPPPALVAGAGVVCTAWTDARHGDPDALARCSHDGGRRWAGVHRLNDDRPGNGARQYLPRLSLAPDGRIDAVFLDRRRDPLSWFNDVFYTFSTDGGRHFAANRKLDGMPSYAEAAPQYAGVAAEGQYEFGSRLGLLSTNRAVVAAWPDTRHASGAGEDIFVNRIRLAGGGRPSWPRVAGRALVLLCLAGWSVIAAGAVRRRRQAPGPGSRRRQVAIAATAAALAVVGGVWALHLASPAPPLTGPRAPLPPPPQQVEVTITEYHYAFTPGIRPGRTVFIGRNLGKAAHTIEIFPVADNLPPVDAQIHGSNRVPIRVLGVMRIQPGATDSFAVDLVKGQRYFMVDFDRGADKNVYALKGLDAEFRAQ